MNASVKGFGLVEVLLALVLGLVMSLALVQIFISSKSSYVSQTSSAGLQEDARFVLSKMVQEVRLVGMFGCLGKVDDATAGNSFSKAFEEPIHWDANSQTLTLATAGTGEGGGWSTWVIHTDCLSSATAYTNGRAPRLAVDETAMPVHRQVYRFNKARNELSLNGQPLASNVRTFSVLFGVAGSTRERSIARYAAAAAPSLIRSVRLTLTLFDPADRAQEQTIDVVAAIRNRLG
ncbi:type IV pilus assembly protein PilW [Pseudomonas graminis]|uniref:pilus assembly protein PilW n=1 Tax=Pseudomonas graminis TaxID=158627 RepID=UPI00105FBD1C|nr:pilus assembly protein PilW [Pseudomonas graminis]TDV51193.1 type IV pilus assembly protein PilW [Pseudomonas graminis]